MTEKQNNMEGRETIEEEININNRKPKEECTHGKI